MRSHTHWILAALGLLATLAVVLAVAAAQDQGPAVLDIDANGKGKQVKAFKHLEHIKLSKKGCTECHHTIKPGETPKKCGVCHTDVKNKDAKTGAWGFKKAFHDNCQGCHKKLKDKPELSKCKACHPRS